MLNKILEAREERWNHRCSLTEKFSSPVITMTMNIPGPQKVSELYIKVHNLILEDFLKTLKDAGFSLIHQEARVSYDGPEAFLVIDGDASSLKQICMQIEEEHPLGRLADIDVMDKNKNNSSRKDFKVPERRCIICGEPVHRCIIAKAHSLHEIYIVTA